jgi:quinol-cytochrome oxidoreductase complex cytochrome b subunit
MQRRRFVHVEEKKQVPFMPHIFFYMTKWALLYLGLLIGIAALWPWDLPTYAGNLAATGVVTEPDWYFLWTFKLVDFEQVTPVIAIGLSNVLIAYILLLPFLDRSKRTHPRDRPLFLYLGNCLIGFFMLLTVWGGLTPGEEIPVVDVAWRLGPIFAVNALVVALFYWRYQRSYRTRLAQAGKSDRLSGAYPVAGRASVAGTSAPSEVASRDS